MDMEDVKYWKQNLSNIQADSPPERIEMVLELLTAQLFALLTGNLNKFDHNLFVAAERNDYSAMGPFIYIDNDRSQWDYTTARSKKLYPVNPWREFCKFPKRIAHRILLLRPGNPRNLTLGGYLTDIASQVFQPHMKNGELFNAAQGIVLDKNIEFVASIIDECLARHPPDHVFIPEPWSQPEVFEDVNVLLNSI